MNYDIQPKPVIDIIKFDIQTNNDWDNLNDKIPFLSDWGVEILKSKLQNFVKTILCECFYICKDHRNLFSNFYSKKFNVGSPYTYRIHFFSDNKIDEKSLIFEKGRCQEHYIGFSVIRPVAERCLGRTVINPEKINIKNSDGKYCLRAKFKTHIFGVEYYIEGYPYTSQDIDATVCAHSTLWGVCRYFPTKYKLYSELYPYDLILMTNSNRGRVVPYRGMTYLDYSNILTSFGCYPIIMRTRKSKDEDFDQDSIRKIYTYVESGFPIVASYGGHVISIIGHTINYDNNNFPDKDGFIDSSQFLEHFIVVDDNNFPYALLGKKDNSNNYRDTYSIEDIRTVVCPLPEKAFLTEEKARIKLMKCVEKQKSLIIEIGERPWVIRLFLTSA